MAGRKQVSMLFWVCGVFLWVCGAAFAQQRAIVERDAQLRAAPQNGAAVVGALKQGTSVEVIVQKGIWVNLKTGSGTGWTNSYNVRFLSASEPASRPSVRAAPSRRTTITSTIGIRGLDEEDLRAAHFDDSQMSLLDQYASTRQDAETAARASGLTRARVEYFQ